MKLNVCAKDKSMSFLRTVPVLAIVFSALAAAHAEDSFAFIDANVLTMENDEILTGHTVLVTGGRIAAIGPSGEIEPPAGARVIDSANRYLMPGLAEMHAHVPGPGGAYDVEDVLFLYVSRGVTVARGMQGQPGQLDLREKAKSPAYLSPTLYLAAPSLSGASVDGPDDARAKVKRYADEGWDLLKVHEALTPEEYAAIAGQAAASGIPFGGHVSDLVGLEEAFARGQRTIDHLDNYLEFMGADEAPVTQAMLDKAVGATRASSSGVVPTSALWERFGTPSDQLEAYEELKYVPKSVVAQWKARQRQIYASVSDDGVDTDVWRENRSKLLKALADGGAEILLGSDAPQIYSVPGFSVHREMAVMAEAGMSPYEILFAGTAAPGEYFADKDTFGTITPGARADLVLLGANPLDHIANAGTIAGVMLRGRWLPKAEIDARLEAIAAKYSAE